MPNYDFTDEEVGAPGDGDHELPTRNSTAGGPAGALGPLRLSWSPGGRSSTAGTASACHIIETTGGEYLKLVADSSLGPPRLTPEGARVQPDWLYAFLREPITIRPWLDVRMPTFGLDDADLNGVDPVFRLHFEHDRPVPDARDHADQERSGGRQGAVRSAALSAVSRPRHDPEGPADCEPGARSADGAGAAQPGLDRRSG